MKNKSIILIVATLLLSAAPCLCAAPAGLKVHLPRSVVIKGKGIRLGDICIIRSSDAARSEKASNVAMGRTPWSKEKIVIDRRTIMSRLAANGFAVKDVRFTGAEKVSMTRSEKVFDSARLAGIAEAFINKTRPAPENSTWRLLRRPEELLTPGDKEVQLKARMGSKLSSGCVSVEIVAFVGQRQVGLATVTFKQSYSIRRLVATRSIPAGGIITRDNTRVTVVSALREGPAWVSPYGMACGRAVRAGAVIAPNLLKAKKPIVVVRRNKSVQMKITMAGFVIVTAGVALEDGRIGDMIKVRNADSKRIIMARVGSDGTVSPVYNHKR